MKTYFVHPNGATPALSEIAEEARRTAGDLQLAGGLAELGDVGRRNEPALLLFAGAGGSAELDALLDFAGRRRSRTYVLYITPDIPAQDYRRLLNAGAGEWVPLESASAELPQVMAKASARLREMGPDTSASATFVAFVPSGGGVGNTTLAAEAAVCLAGRRRSGAKACVCLVDLDLQKGNAADLLDAEPRLDLSDISADPSRLDESMLEVFTSKTEHGVDIIASRKHSVNLLSLDPTGIFAILNAVGRKYDIVILDLPSVFLPWAEEVVRNSDRVFVTASYSVPSALRVTALLHRFDHAHIPRSDVTVVVNKRPSSFFGGGLRRREFEKAIAPVQPLYLTSDEKFAVECSNLGRPMMAVNKRRRICKEIRGLTQSLRPARETKAAGGAKSADRSL